MPMSTPRGTQEPGPLAMIVTSSIAALTVASWAICIAAAVISGGGWHGIAMSAAVAGTASAVSLIARVHHHRATSRGQAGIRAELAAGRAELADARGELAIAREDLHATRQLLAAFTERVGGDHDAILKAIEADRETILCAVETTGAARDEVHRQHIDAVRGELLASLASLRDQNRTYPDEAFERGLHRGIGIVTADIGPLLGELCERLEQPDVGARVRALPVRR